MIYKLCYYLILTNVFIIYLQIIICFIDYFYPPKSIQLQERKRLKDGSGAVVQEKSSGDDEIVQNVKDDLVDEEGSESKEITETSSKEKDSKADTSSPNVRKRKPRKAD